MADQQGKIKICLAGVTGWVGKPLAEQICKSDKFLLTEAVSRKNAGNSVEKVLGIKNCAVTIKSSVKEACKSHPDVLIDYTSASAVYHNVLDALQESINVVVGSSGLKDEQYIELDRMARDNDVGVIAAGNFSLASALMLHFSVLASRYMRDLEIIDYASKEKQDAPSGTALELAHRIGQEMELQGINAKSTAAQPNRALGDIINGINVHSVRLPGIVIGSEVIFGDQSQILSLKYEGGESAMPYISGTLLAAERVVGTRGLVRGLDRLLAL